MRSMLSALALILIGSAAYACGGMVEPVEVTFAGKTINLTAPNIVQDTWLDENIIVAAVREDVPRAGESSARLITLAAEGIAKTFRLASPPLSRSAGCNQPYVTE